MSTAHDGSQADTSPEDLRVRLDLTLERHARAARAGQVGVWDWDVKSDHFYLDPHLLAMLGYDEPTTATRLEDYSAHVHPDDSERVIEEVRRCVHGDGGELSLAHRKVHRDGTTRWFLSRGEVHRDSDGEVIRLVGTDMDITDLKQAQSDLETTRDRLEASVQERTAQLERANRRLRVQMATREQSDSHREAVFLLRQRVWRMESPSDMDTVIEAIEASLEVAGVDYEQYAINLVVEGEEGQRIRQSLKTGQGPWTYRDIFVIDPTRLLRFVREGRVVYRRDLLSEDPYGDASWAVQGDKAYRSVIDVPFAYGTLALNSFEPGAFDDAQVELFNDLAEVLAEGFQRARDLEDLEDRNRQLEQQLVQMQGREAEVQDANAQLAAKDLLLSALHEITTALHEEPEESLILDRFAQQMFGVGMLRSMVISVVDERHRVVRNERSLWRRRNPDGTWEMVMTATPKMGVEYPLDDPGILAETVRVGCIQVVDGWDDRFDPRFGSPESQRGNTSYFIPVAYLGKVTAVLATGSTTANKQEVLQILADLQPVFDHFAIAMHHARLYRLIGERERQLRMAQKMEEMGQLTSGIAHNFNNLLQGVIGNLSLVLDDCDESIRPALEDALRSSRSQAELVRQLMAYARRGPQLDLAPVTVDGLLDTVTSMCRQIFDRQIELSSTSDHDLPPIEGDATQIEQVLLNLCLNARDAVEGQQDRTPRIQVEATLVSGGDQGVDSNDVIRLRVSDNGTGMPDEIREKVFDPFFTTKEPGKGTGLGMSIVQGVVQQHGGRVECESQPGEGTTVSVFLPVSRRKALVEADEPAADLSGTERILIVDDEPMVRDVICRVLERSGYQVLMAVNGAEGLEVLANSEETIDLMLLDLSMPVMSGEGVLDQLAQTHADLPVIVFTGYGQLRKRTRQVASLLPKPVRPIELLRTIRTTLDS
ncbi:MAG: response regulator [Gemmatimonadetes bacterium]|nr:response regulator [Gemmatimonadota bacterium]MBT7859879.1 response regulator [Gemmatimonadota bacterium]